MKEVLFYFDFASPFAYLGSTQIESVAARHHATIAYRPFLLGALFKAIGTPDVPIFTMPAAKQSVVQSDMFRWADHWGVPFRFPTRFPMNTVKALRMVLQTPAERRGALVGPLFRAYWAEDRDLADDAVLAAVATAAGFDGPALVEGTRSDAVKHALRTATEEAVARGLCGAPTFVVGDLLFWGQDRLHFVGRALDGWRPAHD
jgi:2-hydroxychromene-2-carboxylate isomerase